MPSKRDLFQSGCDLIKAWTDKNRLAPVVVEESDEPKMFGTCAFYRNGKITICVAACAHPGTTGMAWSWPGYSVDRTPYGVLAHELGHDVDKAHGAAGGFYGKLWREETGEAALTSYCPNSNEWFAEMFRLFVTNPDLLKLLRPQVYLKMRALWEPVVTESWNEVLRNSPRHIKAATNKIAEAMKRR